MSIKKPVSYGQNMQAVGHNSYLFIKKNVGTRWESIEWSLTVFEFNTYRIFSKSCEPQLLLFSRPDG